MPNTKLTKQKLANHLFYNKVAYILILIIAIMGAALAINGISGYRQSKWAGFFLMVFGTLLCLGNLIMLGQ